MNIEFTCYNTLPNRKDAFWQIVLLPTISIYKNTIKKHVVVNFEWLFWSVNILIGKSIN